jgi:hypothetical protein
MSEASPRVSSTSDLRGMPLAAFLVLLGAYHFTFGRFFPTASGTVGEDYALTLPALLAGYFWSSTNGVWSVPWFMPSFCGGIPFFADPQGGFFTLLQIATLFVDPLASAYLTTLAFASLGYWGCYVLLRRTFAVAQFPAFLGAAIFMFNGFFAHRALIGHLGFQGFMLVPWVAYALMTPAPLRGFRKLGGLGAACATGLIAAYWLDSGLGTLMVPVGLSVVLILLVLALRQDAFPLRRVVLRGCIGVLFAGALSAAKLVVAFATLSNFPRSGYLLPGYASMADAFRILFTSLFFSPTDIRSLSDAALRNAQLLLLRHELEYGVTVVPLLILLAGLVVGLARIARSRLGAKRAAILLLIGIVLVVPLALNTYSPEWNALLRRIPLLKSSSNFVRWFCVYIPFLAVLSAVVVDGWSQRIRAPVAVLGVAAVIATNLMQDRAWYAMGGYNPGPVTAAYRTVRNGGSVPPISAIGVSVKGPGALDRNDALIVGVSQLYCYDPTFGYALENLPIRDLHPGPVRAVTDGRYNMKNPACYVYPKENGCSPGDHFRTDQALALESFVAYRPFEFKVSLAQRVANLVTLIALGASGIVLASVLAIAIRANVRERRSALSS